MLCVPIMSRISQLSTWIHPFDKFSLKSQNPMLVPLTRGAWLYDGITHQMFFIFWKLDYTRRARVARRIYCVETHQISLADTTIREIVWIIPTWRNLQRDGNGQVRHSDCLRSYHVLQNVLNGSGFERGLSSRHACFAESWSRTECDRRQTTDRRRRTNRKIRGVPTQ